MNLEFKLQELEDQVARENFFRIKKFVDQKVFLRGEWVFFEIALTQAVTNYKFKHGLTYSPTDVIQTSSIGAGVLSWNYSKFNKDFLDITTTGPATVRAFVGRFEPDSDR